MRVLRSREMSLPRDTLNSMRTAAAFPGAGKGDRRRTVGIDSGATPMIQRWEDVRAARRTPPPGVPLFCSQKCRRLSRSCVREMLVRNAARTGIYKRVHPHGLRHTMAYELLMEGVPIPIAELHHGVAKQLPRNAAGVPHIAPKQVIETITARSWCAP